MDVLQAVRTDFSANMEDKKSVPSGDATENDLTAPQDEFDPKNHEITHMESAVELKDSELEHLVSKAREGGSVGPSLQELHIAPKRSDEVIRNASDRVVDNAEIQELASTPGTNGAKLTEMEALLKQMCSELVQVDSTTVLQDGRQDQLEDIHDGHSTEIDESSRRVHNATSTVLSETRALLERKEVDLTALQKQHQELVASLEVDSLRYNTELNAKQTELLNLEIILQTANQELDYVTSNIHKLTEVFSQETNSDLSTRLDEQFLASFASNKNESFADTHGVMESLAQALQNTLQEIAETKVVHDCNTEYIGDALCLKGHFAVTSYVRGYARVSIASRSLKPTIQQSIFSPYSISRKV